MDFDVLEGDLVTLHPLDMDHADRLAEDMQAEVLYSDAGLIKPPSAESLAEDIEDGELLICDMIPDESDKPVGYAGIVGYSGPPYVFVHYLEGKPTDLDMAREAFLLLAHAFFARTNEDQLWTYQPKPVPDEIQDLLLEGGFDPWDTHVPGINNETTACFILERHTYNAYYADEDSEADHEVFEDY